MRDVGKYLVARRVTKPTTLKVVPPALYIFCLTIQRWIQLTHTHTQRYVYCFYILCL